MKNILTTNEKKRLAHLGMKYSDKHKKAISDGLKGKKKSKAHKEKISITLKRKYKLGLIKKPFLGKHHSKETIKHLKEIKKDYWKLNKNPKWKGGIKFEKYGYEWNDELKEKARKRDNYKCQLCNKLQKKKKLDVHHIDENKKNNKLENLISLCHHCHILLHNKKERISIPGIEPEVKGHEPNRLPLPHIDII